LRAAACTPLNATAKLSDIVRWSDSATDPPSFHYGATSAVAQQLNNAHNLCVSEFQFGGLPAVALAKAGDSFMLFV
jgi:hypothetical protein